MRPEEWVAVCDVDDVPRDGGACVLLDGVQIAVFHIATPERWYATQNRCPHWNEMVLWRALTGEQDGKPKIACPMHKKAFSLDTGACLSGDDLALRTFSVKVADGRVYLARPAVEFVHAERCAPEPTGAAESAGAAGAAGAEG